MKQNEVKKPNLAETVARWRMPLSRRLRVSAFSPLSHPKQSTHQAIDFMCLSLTPQYLSRQLHCILLLRAGVGGIEAEAVMLGQPISMVLPEVVGYKLVGNPQPLVTSTDIVLTITKVNYQDMMFFHYYRELNTFCRREPLYRMRKNPVCASMQ